MNDIFTTQSQILITCNKRLTPYLEKEVIALGFTPKHVFTTGLELKGTVNDCIKLNLNLYCASQVHYLLKSFTANHPDDVYDALTKLAWEEILTNDGYFSVTSNVDNVTVNNNLFVNVKVKDAIVDRMRMKTGARPDSGPSLEETVIYFYWKDNQAQVFLDTSGETLAKHGYRKMPGKAPMLEALAAATIMASKWDMKSPFINPMCGSGTLAIEAALQATKRRPGLFRKNYSFMHIKGYDESVYRAERKKLDDIITDVAGLEIVATDISEVAIKTSKINAAAAGVEKLIRFDVCDFEETKVPESSGVVYCNPEYGERLGQIGELEATYARIGDFLKNDCQGYLGYIFTANFDLAKKIGLKASRRIEFYSAKLDCRLLEFELYSGTRKKKDIL